MGCLISWINTVSIYIINIFNSRTRKRRVPSISIKGYGFVFFLEENRISTQIVLRKIKRYWGVIQSENYKYGRKKHDKDEIGNILDPSMQYYKFYHYTVHWIILGNDHWTFIGVCGSGYDVPLSKCFRQALSCSFCWYCWNI